MPTVSLTRLYVLRASYLLVVVGLGSTIWPLILQPPVDVEHMRSVVWSLLAGVSLLAALGIRYPLQLLPVLLFELVWKAAWVLAIGLPRYRAGSLTGPMADTWAECLFGVALFALVIPWRYVWHQYVRRAADPWRKAAAA